MIPRLRYVDSKTGGIPAHYQAKVGRISKMPYCEENTEKLRTINMYCSYSPTIIINPPPA